MLIQAPVFLARRIRRLSAPLRSPTEPLTLVLYAVSWSLFHTRMNEDTSNLYTNILSGGKCCYNSLPMGMSNSSENFQQK